MAEPIMRKARGDGVELQVAIWEGPGKTLLCIHGLTANCRCWDLIAGTMSQKHRVIAMDLRGRGHSGRPETGYSIDQHCRDIIRLMDDLGLETVIPVGHSLGASIALALGARHPDRVDRMVLLDGAGKLSKEQMIRVFAGIKPALDRLGKIFPSFEAYIDLLKKAPFLQPWSPNLETYFRYEVESVDGGVGSRVQPEHIAEESLNMKDVDVAQLYRDIACPVLILRATEGMLAQDDILLPQEAVDRMLKEIPDARYIDILGTNHYSIIFQPNGVRDQAMLDFLDA